MVLKPTHAAGIFLDFFLSWMPHAAAAKNCAFSTHHLPPPPIYRLTGHEVTSSRLHVPLLAKYSLPSLKAGDAVWLELSLET